MGQPFEIRVPDIGDFEEVEVVEILVARGDRVEFDDPIVTVESDKATMEIPSPAAGTVVDVRVAEGDRVSEGSVLLVLDADEQAVASPAETDAGDGVVEATEREGPEGREVGHEEALATPLPSPPPRNERPERPEHPERPRRELPPDAANPVPDRTDVPHASPLVRRYARELGVPIEETEGTGPKGRILVEDLKRHVRACFAQGRGQGPGNAAAMTGIPPVPFVDPSAFGPVHERALTRIQRVSGPALHRSWLNIPHVTQYDEADVTELERFRRERKAAAADRGLRLSPLLFVMKAVVVALEAHPTLRSSLAPEGDRLVVKDFFHFGIAVDTEEGLVVPVIRDVDRKGIFELAAEVAATAERARARKLRPEDLQGASFTISSLGGIGGTAFSPIINAPEVAILGLSKTRVEPRWQGPPPLDPSPPSGRDPEETEDGGRRSTAGHFEPRLILPFSLSYDHRVIDGAEAVRFTTRLARVLRDPVQLLLV